MSYIESMLLEDEIILYTGRKHATLLFGRVIGEILLLILMGACVVAANLYLYNTLMPSEQFLMIVYAILLITAIVLIEIGRAHV